MHWNAASTFLVFDWMGHLVAFIRGALGHETGHHSTSWSTNTDSTETYFAALDLHAISFYLCEQNCALSCPVGGTTSNFAAGPRQLVSTQFYEFILISHSFFFVDWVPHLKKRGEVYDLFIQLADPTCAIGFVTVAPLAHYVTGWAEIVFLGGSWLRCDGFPPNGDYDDAQRSKGSSSKLALFHILFQDLWSCCWNSLRNKSPRWRE